MAKFLKSFGLPLLGGVAGSFLGGKMLSPMLSKSFGQTAGGYLGSALGGAAGGAITSALTKGKPAKSALIGGATGLAGQAISNISRTGGLTSQPRQTSSPMVTNTPTGGGESMGGVLARKRGMGNLLGLPSAGGRQSLNTLTSPNSSEQWGGVSPSVSSRLQYSSYPGQEIGRSVGAGVAHGVGQGVGQALTSAFNPVSDYRGMMGGGGGQPPSTPPPSGGGGPNLSPVAQASNSFMGLDTGDLKKAGIQGAFGLAGDAFAPEVEAPNFGNIPSIESLRNSAGLPQTELGSLAQQRLTEQLKAPFGLEPGVEQNIQRVFDERRKALISQFKTIRPNADLTSDTAFRQAMYNLDQQEAETLSMARQRAYDTFQTQRRQDIATALGIDEQRLEVLIQAANLDVQQIMIQFGIDAQKAQDFKQTFTQLGAILTGQGEGQ